MLWSRRSALLGCGALTACGFEPVYKQGGAAEKLNGKIGIEVQDGRYRFEYREALQSKLGKASVDAPYLLNYKLKISEDELVLTSAVEIARYNLSGVLTFNVIERGTDAIAFADTVRSSTAYSATSETFPTRAAEQDANIRLVRALADQTASRIAITADDWLT